MSVRELECPKCRAQVSVERTICDYCGTYYVVENNMTYTLESRQATDENLRKWFDNMELERRHLVKASPQKPDDEATRRIRDSVFVTRDHLKEELKRVPTIKEVDERATKYLRSYVHRKYLK